MFLSIAFFILKFIIIIFYVRICERFSLSFLKLILHLIFLILFLILYIDNEEYAIFTIKWNYRKNEGDFITQNAARDVCGRLKIAIKKCTTNNKRQKNPLKMPFSYSSFSFLLFLYFIFWIGKMRVDRLSILSSSILKDTHSPPQSHTILHVVVFVVIIASKRCSCWKLL